MENHPIPQDVTGFQFKLIGDMTIKQFAYLATGCIIAGIFIFGITSPNFILIRLPIIFFSGGLGMALAFLPIEGRPLDVMLINFMRAVFVSNQFVFQKVGGQINIPVITQKKTSAKGQIARKSPEDLQTLLRSFHREPQNKVDQKEAEFLKALFTMPAGKGFQTRPQGHGFARILSVEDDSKKIKQKQISDSEIEKEEFLKKERELKVEEKKDEQKAKEALDRQASMLEQELQRTKVQETANLNVPVTSTAAHIKVFELENQLRTTLAQKQQLERQLFALSRKFETQKEPVYTPVSVDNKTTEAQSPKETPNVIQIPKGMGAKYGLPIATDVPNLITGIIRDPRGNILPNILVEITDKDGNPVRAFKTNNLGQFASATPLLNGIYTLILEDPEEKNRFDRIEINANGEAMLPIEIISTDAREDLRKDLFGT